MMYSRVRLAFHLMKKTNALGVTIDQFAIRRSPTIHQLNFVIIQRTLSTDDIIVKQRGPVKCFGINRTHKKNCLTPQLVTRLLEEIESFEKDDRSFVGVLYGERGTFSYGIDPDDLQDNGQIYEEIVQTGLLQKYPLKPIVAAVNGYAIGLAFDLALWCDFRVAEDTSVMASYARNSGIPADEQLVRRLVDCVGSHRAMDWLLTGRPVKAKEALEAGAITRTVACGTGVGQAFNFAHSLANMPHPTLKADRALIYSTSMKFEDTKLINREWERNRAIAAEESARGSYITSTGDVRHKDWS